MGMMHTITSGTEATYTQQSVSSRLDKGVLLPGWLLTHTSSFCCAIQLVLFLVTADACSSFPQACGGSSLPLTAVGVVQVANQG